MDEEAVTGYYWSLELEGSSEAHTSTAILAGFAMVGDLIGGKRCRLCVHGHGVAGV